jgi:hypothetical protein
MRNLRPADFEATHYPAVVKLSGEECPSCAPFPERHLFCAFLLATIVAPQTARKGCGSARDGKLLELSA